MQQEVSQMCLNIITPVNISDGTKLTAKDYFYSPKQQKAYFLDLQKWHHFIYQHGLLSAYERYVGDYKDKRNLLTWLEAQKFTLKDVQNIIVGEAQAEVNLINAEKKNTLNDVDKHIQQADGSLYIPGSSIKGVFRTAILYKLLEENKILKNEYWQKIARYVDALDRILAEQRQLNYDHKLKKQADVTFNNISKFSQKIEADLLHTLQLKEKGKSVENGNAVCNSLRGLHVSDTISSEDIHVAILQKIDGGFGKFGNAATHPLPIFRECMLPGAKLYFDVKLDKAFMSTLGINSIDDLLLLTQKYFDAVVKLLQDAFGGQFSEQFTGIENANIFLGRNTGFLSKTFLAMLAPDAEQAKNIIKVLLEKSFKQHKHILYDKFISPRTLKCTRYQGKLILMGLAEVRKV